MDPDLHLVFSRENYELFATNFNLPEYKRELDQPPFPSRDDFLIFSKEAYNGDISIAGLPSTWSVLTTARNADNGYFGVAFWSPELQQVTIAHRGTVFPNMRNVISVLSGGMKPTWDTAKADLNGVYLNKYTPYMASAVTFAHKIKALILTLNKKQKNQFRLSLTGHSLGAWMAQVTAYTTMYLTINHDKFCQGGEGMLAHTVVFDSPGCRSMMLKIKDDYDKRCSGTMSFDILDIDGYVIAANIVNTCDLHVGRVLIVPLTRDYCQGSNKVADLSKQASVFIVKRVLFLDFTNVTLHSLEKFAEAFLRSEELRLVVDWPVGGKETEKLHNLEVIHNTFNPQTNDGVRYESEPFSKTSCFFNIFSNGELRFLDTWNGFDEDKSRFQEIEDLFIKNDWGDYSSFFGKYYLDEARRVVQCASEEDRDKLLRRTKQLFRWFPTEMEEIMQKLQLRAPELVCRVLSTSYHRLLPEILYSCEDTISLRDFLLQDSRNLLCMETDDTKFLAARLKNILSNLNKSEEVIFEKEIVFLTWDSLLDMGNVVHIEELLKNNNFSDKKLLILDYESDFVTFLQKIPFILKRLTSFDKKMIFLFRRDDDTSTISTDLFDECSVKFASLNSFDLNDLTENSRSSIMSKKVISIAGKEMSLNEFLGRNGPDVSVFKGIINKVLRKMVTDENYVISVKNQLLNPLDLNVHCHNAEMEVNVDKVTNLLTREDILLVLSGEPTQLKGENVAYMEGNGEQGFLQKCLANPEKIVYWLDASTQHLTLKQVYNEQFYIDRKFYNRYGINVKQLLQQPNPDVFVVKNVQDNNSLMNSLDLSERKKRLFSDNLNFVNGPVLEVGNKSVHYVRLEEGSLVWEKSRGSLERLRPYVTLDTSRSIGERELLLQGKKFMIIADEPGMGKSTSLTSLGALVESSWVMRFHLKTIQRHIKNLPVDFSLTSIAEFLLQEEGNVLEQDLFKCCLHPQVQSCVYLLFDGFDEVRDDEFKIKGKILKLLKFLKENTSANIVVTSRKYLTDEVENFFAEFVTVFESVKYDDQLNFLSKFWYCHMLLLGGDTERWGLRNFAENFYLRAQKTLGREIKSLMGIPLLTRMLAVVLLPEVIQQYQEPSFNIVESSHQINSIVDLYRKFIDLKYSIYTSEKSESGSEFGEIYKSHVDFNYRVLGCQVLDEDFTKKHIMLFTVDNKWKEVLEMNKLGLLQTTSGGRFEFTHRTFAEYFCADLLVQWLKQNEFPYNQLNIATTFLRKFLLDRNFRVVRKFLDSSLRLEDSEICIKEFNVNDVEMFRNDLHQTALHIAVDEMNIHILNLLLQSLDLSNKNNIAFLKVRDKSDSISALGAALASDNPEIINPIINTIDSCEYETKLDILLALLVEWLCNTTKHNYSINSSYYQKNILKNTYIKNISGPVLEQIHNLFEEIDNFDERFFFEDSMIKVFKSLKNDVERYYFPMIRNMRGETLINIVTTRGNMRLLKLFVNKDVLNSTCSVGNTPLHCAVKETEFYVPKEERIEIVRYLLKNGSEVDHIDSSKKTALFHASENGYREIVEILLHSGANRTFLDQYGMTTLFYAVAHGHITIVKLLLWYKGPSEESNFETLNIHDPDFLNGRTVFHYAAHEGLLDIVNLLLRLGADIQGKDSSGRTALSLAAERGHLQIVNTLSDTTNLTDETALHFAAQYGHLEIVNLLVSRGLDVNTLDHFYRSALFYAATAGYLKIVEYLLQQNANVKSTDGSLIHHIITCKKSNLNEEHIQIIELLLRKGINYKTVDGHGITALSHAADKGYFDIVKLLVNQYINIDCKDGYNALFRAAGNGHVDIVDFLVPNLKKINFLGHTALSRAAANGHINVVKYLYACGININVRDKAGQDALSYAAEGGHIEVVSYLLGQGAIIDSIDKNHETPLFYAVKAGRALMADFLLDSGAEIDSKNIHGETPLSCAIKSNIDNKKIILNLLIHGAHIDLKGIDDINLISAVVRHQSEIVFKILSKWNLKKFYPEVVMMALIFAVHSGKKEIVQLFETYIKLNVCKVMSSVPFLAVNCGHCEIFNYLLAILTEVGTTDCEIRNAAIFRIKGAHELVDYSLYKNGYFNHENISKTLSCTINKDRKLIDMIMYLRFKNVCYFPNKRVKLVISFESDAKTALEFASGNGYTGLVQLLFESEEFTRYSKFKTQFGEAVIAAAKNGWNQVMEYLLEQSSDVNYKCEKGLTPLHWAARNGHLETVKIIFENGTEILLEDSNGKTAKTYALENGHTNISEFLNNPYLNWKRETEMY